MDKNIRLKFSLDVVVISLALIIPMVGYFNYLFNGLISSVILIVLYIIYLSITNKLILYKRDFKYDFKFLVVFSIVVFLNYLFVDLNPKSKEYTIVFFYFIILYIIDLILNKDFQKKVTVIFILLLVLGVQALISIPYIITSDFLLIRSFSQGILSKDEALEAMKNGIGTNALYTSLSSISIFSFALQSIIRSKLAKIILLISSLSMIISIFISTFFASILLFLIALGTYILLQFRSIISLKKIIFGVLIFLGILFFYNNYLSSTRLLDPVEKKLEKFQSGQEDATGREALAKVSLNTFYDNPFLGIGVPDWRSYDKIGEHMTWVDYLANFGVIGFSPLLLFLSFTIYYRLRKSVINNRFNIICTIGILIFILSNFISPMLTTPITYISFLLIYRSISFKNA